MIEIPKIPILVTIEYEKLLKILFSEATNVNVAFIHVDLYH